jgi:hypothetical protein
MLMPPAVLARSTMRAERKSMSLLLQLRLQALKFTLRRGLAEC